VLQCVAVCCSVLQCVAVCCSVLQCVAVCCSVLQSVAVSCSDNTHNTQRHALSTPCYLDAACRYTCSKFYVKRALYPTMSKRPTSYIKKARFPRAKDPFFQKTPLFIQKSPVSYSVARIRRIPYLHKSFISAKEPYIPQKSPITGGSFAKETSNLRHPVHIRHPVRQKSPVSYAKGPLYSISKEPCILCQKSPLFYIKRALFPTPKDPSILYQKSPVFYVKKALYCISKEPCFLRQKTPLCYIKRALYLVSSNARI